MSTGSCRKTNRERCPRGADRYIHELNAGRGLAELLQGVKQEIIAMGSVGKQIDRERNLTTYQVSGRVSAGEYARNIQEFYAIGPITKHVMWDLTRAELEHLREEDVRSIGETPRKFSEERNGGRTAIVAPTDLAFGLARMYEFISDPSEVLIEIQVFRSVEEATQWLEEA